MDDFLSWFAIVYYTGLFIVAFVPLGSLMIYLIYTKLKQRKVEIEHVIFLIVLQVCWIFGLWTLLMRLLLK